MKETSSLIILGMHRSGTSLLTGLLSQVGVKMGRSLYKAQKGVNEKGFWEHEDIVDTHDELLLALNSQWDDLLPLPEGWTESDAVRPFVARLENLVRRDFSACVWALKDPRMCRLLPLWMRIFEKEQVKPTFVLMNRNPFEVGASLEKRDCFSRKKALILWLSHSLYAERYSRGQSRIFINFDEVVQNPVETLTRIERAANLAFPVPITAASETINDFVSPSLRHHKAGPVEEAEQNALSSMASELYRLFADAPADDSEFHRLIDAVASEFAAYQKNWNSELLEQIRYLNEERADYRIKFFRIYKSWSWLLVKPLWLIEKILRKY